MHNVQFESGDPSRQRVVPTSGCGRMVSHGLDHGITLHAILGRLAHFDEGQPVTFPAVADDLVDVPDDSRIAGTLGDKWRIGR